MQDARSNIVDAILNLNLRHSSHDVAGIIHKEAADCTLMDVRCCTARLLSTLDSLKTSMLLGYSFLGRSYNVIVSSSAPKTANSPIMDRCCGTAPGLPSMPGLTELLRHCCHSYLGHHSDVTRTIFA